VDTLIQIRNLSKTFNGGTVNENAIFKDLSIDIKKGDFITIIGSNGAGKSTLLNMIAGSLELDSGSIILENKDVSKLPEYKRTRYIGRVFQNPSMGTSPSMTILENLSMAYNKGKRYGLTLGVSKKNIPYFKELLSKLNLGLEGKLHTKVGLLSGGQRQSLTLLMATMSNPLMLLLDEHTAALDPKTSERIIELTEQIVANQNITTLMITHNLHHAIAMGNRLIMMHRGKIMLDITGDEKKDLTIEKLLEYFDKLHFKDELSDRMLFT
jgi:putative tryptophan/tyrosine transport system ATP-binding protein